MEHMLEKYDGIMLLNYRLYRCNRNVIDSEAIFAELYSVSSINGDVEYIRNNIASDYYFY